MKTPLTQRGVLALAQCSEAQRVKFLSRLTPPELLAFDAAFEAWAAVGQHAPIGEGWRVWLMMAGRGYGKTRAGAEWIHRLAMTGDKRIALVGATIDEARAIMVEGVSGLLSLARRHRVKVVWEPSRGRLTWPRGSEAQLFSGESPEGLRGPEHDFAWCARAHRPAARRVGRRRSDHRAPGEPDHRQFLSSRVGRDERRIRRA